MKKLAFLMVSAIAISSCANNSTSQDDVSKIQSETMKIHDEIMPQISHFDKSTLKIDSLIHNLAALKTAKPAIDTTIARQELTTLKANLEDATDHMMDWMKDYSTDSTSSAYANSELTKVKAMKEKFERVTKENQEVLKKY